MHKLLQIFLLITLFIAMTSSTKADDVIILDSLWNEDSEIWDTSSKLVWIGTTLGQRFTIEDDATITSASIFGARSGFAGTENPMVYAYIYAINDDNLPIGSPLYSATPISIFDINVSPDFAEVKLNFNNAELSAGSYCVVWTIDLYWGLSMTRYDTEPENYLGNWYNNTTEIWYTYFTYNYKIYGYYPIEEEEEGGIMEEAHFYALIPLLVFLILSMIWYGRGLLHIMTFAYTIILAVMAIGGEWELLFFAPLAGVAVISIILFGVAMSKGDWL